MSEKMSHEIRVLIIARDSPDPHLRQREHKINLLRPHSGTLLRRLSTLRTSTTMVVTPLIQAVCKNTCEMNLRCWLPAWTKVTTMLRFQVGTACLKLAELPEALAIVQAARRGASDSNRHSPASRGGKGNVCPTVYVISDRAMTDQLRSSEELNDLGHNLNNAEARICKQSWTNEKQAASVMRVARPDIGQANRIKTLERDRSCQCRLMFLMFVFSVPPRVLCSVNSMDVGRREGARGVIDTAARYTVAGRAWDRAYRQICAERGIGHLINVTPESEVYRFGNGGLLTSTERVTVPVVLADHRLLLSYSVVESPVLSLLIGRDVVEGLGLDIKGSSKTLEYNGRSQPLEDSVAGHYFVTLSPERYAGLLKLESSPDPPTSRVPRHLFRRVASQDLHRRWKFVSLQQQHLWTAQVRSQLHSRFV